MQTFPNSDADRPDFPSGQWHGVTFSVERFDDVAHELYPLFLEHWRETEQATRQTEQPNPNWQRFAALDELGYFVLCCMRNADGLLVGYLMLFITPELHIEGRLRCQEGGIFITRTERKGLVAKQFLGYGEICAKMMGVTSMTASCKAPSGAPEFGRLLKRMGYTHVAQIYSKEFR